MIPPSRPTNPVAEDVVGHRGSSRLIPVVALLVVAGITFALLPRDDSRPLGSKPTEPQPTSEPQPTDGGASTPRAKVFVPGEGPEVDTGVACEAGGTIVMTATGTVDQDTAVFDPRFGPDGYLGQPAGYRAVYADYAPGALVGGLLPVDGNAIFGGFVDDGTATDTYRAEYVCPIAGWIWLGVNDPILWDNDGGFDVTIW